MQYTWTVLYFLAEPRDTLPMQDCTLFRDGRGAISATPMRTHVLRLLPGDDLLPALEAWVQQHAIGAGFILTAVGSLTRSAIRFANQPTATLSADGHYEIVSLIGTLGTAGYACPFHGSESGSPAWFFGFCLDSRVWRGVGGGCGLNWSVGCPCLCAGATCTLPYPITWGIARAAT